MSDQAESFFHRRVGYHVDAPGLLAVIQQHQLADLVALVFAEVLSADSIKCTVVLDLFDECVNLCKKLGLFLINTEVFRKAIQNYAFV